MPHGPAKRSYDDACGAAHALDLVGERWALLIMRELMFGPKRFGDLRASLPGLSANVLTQRLESLEAAGILARRKLPPPASVQVYGLTPWGQESEPIFQVLGRWAARSPAHDPTLPLSATSLLLSFRTMFRSRQGGRRPGAARLPARPGELSSWRWARGRLEAARDGGDGAVDVTLTGAPPLVAAFVYGGQPLAGLEAAGLLRIEGDRAVFERFATWFELPPKASPAA